jgi:hypothetical protein
MPVRSVWFPPDALTPAYSVRPDQIDHCRSAIVRGEAGRRDMVAALRLEFVLCEASPEELIEPREEFVDPLFARGGSTS